MVHYRQKLVHSVALHRELSRLGILVAAAVTALPGGGRATALRVWLWAQA
jgi:hypothetical protein